MYEPRLKKFKSIEPLVYCMPYDTWTVVASFMMQKEWYSMIQTANHFYKLFYSELILKEINWTFCMICLQEGVPNILHPHIIQINMNRVSIFNLFMRFDKKSKKKHLKHILSQNIPNLKHLSLFNCGAVELPSMKYLTTLRIQETNLVIRYGTKKIFPKLNRIEFPLTYQLEPIQNLTKASNQFPNIDIVLIEDTYHYSRPVCFEQLEPFIKNNNCIHLHSSYLINALSDPPRYSCEYLSGFRNGPYTRIFGSKKLKDYLTEISEMRMEIEEKESLVQKYLNDALMHNDSENIDFFTESLGK